MPTEKALALGCTSYAVELVLINVGFPHIPLTGVALWPGYMELWVLERQIASPAPMAERHAPGQGCW